ncbi:MAG: GNAT family N-acetyltransferase [Lachnospiraceae bacterium]
MIQLDRKELKKYRTYIRDTSSIYFSCILNGDVPGIVWTDCAEEPEFLLVWSPYQEGFQLMGKPSSREKKEMFQSWFAQTILPFLKNMGMDYFEYGVDTKELAEWFQSMFHEQDIFTSKQKIFRLSETGKDFPKPEGYQIERVTSDFLKKGYHDTELILDEIKQAYGDDNVDFEYNIMYAAIKDQTVVARADMLFHDNGYGNISVHTQESHRRKGLSAYLTQKIIEDTKNLGLIPIWDCAQDNLASEKTAEKCGFQKIREDVIWGFLI